MYRLEGMHPWPRCYTYFQIVYQLSGVISARESLPSTTSNLFIPTSTTIRTGFRVTYIYPNRFSTRKLIVLDLVFQLSCQKSEHVFTAPEKAAAGSVIHGCLSFTDISRSVHRQSISYLSPIEALQCMLLALSVLVVRLQKGRIDKLDIGKNWVVATKFVLLRIEKEHGGHQSARHDSGIRDIDMRPIHAGGRRA